MAKDLIGYRFSPTGEELINDYLKNKNVGKTWLIKDEINEINICSFEPKYLPPLAKINTDDLVWYFFSPIVYANTKKTTMKRTTGSGYWKATGKDCTIKDKRGNKSEIGIKKTLVYHEGKGTNGVQTPWVMHEYHITCLPPNLTTSVLCQVKYKGDHGDISFGGNGSVVSHSNTVRAINNVSEVDQTVEVGLYLNDLSIPLNFQENLCPVGAINPNLQQQTPEVQIEQPVLHGMSLDDLERPVNGQEDLRPLDAIDPNMIFNYDNPNLLPQTPYDDDYFDDLLSYNGGNFEDVIPNQVLVQENRNVYMPKKALSGIIVDCSSDSDSGAESISVMSYQGTSSPHDSVGISNKHFSRCSSTERDLQTSAYVSVSQKIREWQLTQPTLESKREVKRDKSKPENMARRGKSREKETSMVKTKKSCFIIKKAIESYCNKPQYIYLRNMIIGFILLVGFIGYIKS